MSKRILIVDDDVEIVELIDKRLKNEGYSSMKANDSKSALEIIENTELDMIIMDITMPGVDGSKLCYILKEGERFNSIPVLIMSARPKMDLELTARSVKADDFLPKPFDANALLKKIKSLTQ